jgi:multidrug resistance efflux pump
MADGETKRREIKMPVTQMWREFRMRYLPIGVFLAAGVTAFLLWQQTVVGPTLIGEVEAVQATVTTPDAGYVTNLHVRPMQLVKAGDVIAEIVSTDVRLMSSQVQDLRSRIAMSQLEVSSMMDRERIAFDFQSLSMNTLRFRADLAAARAEMPTLEAALKRAEQGWKDRVLPYNDYELALRTHDSVKARVGELEKLVADAESRLNDAASTAGSFTNFAAGKSLPEAIQRLTSQRQGVEDIRRTPLLLRSPIDGTVGSIMRRAGENVLAGDIIVTIHALTGDRIQAYLRQGMLEVPRPGTPVTVRCRSHSREEGKATVEDVGYRYEAITNQALLRPGVLFERGMPIGITMPESLRSILHPGELVDVAIGQ